jgi:hypothetical protein
MGFAEPAIPIYSLQLLKFFQILWLLVGTEAGLEPAALDHDPNEFNVLLYPV